MTRNFLSVWRYAPLKFPINTEFLLGSKIKYFVVLSVSSCEKFFKRKRNYIHGELSEWSKVQHSKCCVPKRNLGFESLTLRQGRLNPSVKSPYFLVIICSSLAMLNNISVDSASLILAIISIALEVHSQMSTGILSAVNGVCGVA